MARLLNKNAVDECLKPAKENTTAMKPTVLNGVITTVVLLTLSIFAQGKPAAAQNQPRRLADSLTTVYENADGEAGFVSSLRFDPETASLEDYLVYAALQNPSLRAAFHNWKAALEKTGYAGALPDPRFSYSYFIENVETRVGPQIQILKLQQAFPWFGTLGARKDISVEAASAAYQKYEANRLALFYEVKSVYYEFYYLGRAIAITRENLELLKFWESIARAKYRVALKQYPDVIKAQVELGKLEDRLLTIQDMVEPVAARLKAILTLPDSLQLPLPADIEVGEAAVVADSVYELVLANNPDLKSLLHVVEKGRATKRLAAKESYPDFVVGVGYVNIGEALDPNMPDSGKDAWTATVGITLPIWFGANKSRRQEAEAQYRRARYNNADAINRLRAVTEKIVFEYEDALRKTRLYRDGLVPKAEQSLNANYTAYQAGETDFLNLLDTQRQLLDFQLQFERSRSNLAIRRAELEMISGTDLIFATNDE
jgi:cobalt-zinc-cadmium efflux system outer membrane protein